jgi:hypothetical protein
MIHHDTRHLVSCLVAITIRSKARFKFCVYMLCCFSFFKEITFVYHEDITNSYETFLFYILVQ